jgi:ribosomal protein S18 acetylase RimI-like enzyme
MDERPIGNAGIRPFRESDLPALYRAEEACFQPPQRFSRSLIRSLTRNPNCRTWVADCGEELAAFAILDRSGVDATQAAYIITIEVLPQFRRKGIAIELLRRLEESAREMGLLHIELHVSERNPDAQRLYERGHYTRVRVEPKYYGRNESAWLYRKTLAASESSLAELGSNSS